MSRTHPKSFRTSLAVTLGAVAVIPILVVSVLAIDYLARGTVDDITRKNLMIARAVEGQVESFLDAPLKVLDNIRRMLLYSQGQPVESVRRMLDAHIGDASLFESIYILNGAGVVVSVGLPGDRAEYREEFEGIQLSHKDFFRNALNTGELQWSNTFLSLISGKMSLALCLPVNPDRFLVGNFNIENLGSFVRGIELGRGMSIAVIDRDGAVIVHPDAKVEARQVNVGHLAIVRDGFTTGEWTGRYEYEGVRLIGSSVLIPGPRWLAMVSQTEAEALAHVVHTGKLFGTGALAALALAVIFALARATSFARPIARLAAQSKVVAQGKYELSLPEPEHAEIKELADSFRTMAAAVRAREEELLESRKRYQLLLESMKDGMVAVDRDGLVTYVNPSLREMLGYTEDEMTGRPVTDFFDAGNREIIEEQLRKRQRGESESYDVEWICKDGSRKLTAVSGRVLATDAGMVGSFGVVRDMTEQRKAAAERRKLEEQLLQAQKMESIGRLAGGVAHDFNNMLSAILGYSELSLLKTPSDAPIVSYLETIRSSAERAADLTKQLLAFSRKQALETKVVSLGRLVADMGGMLRRMIGEDVILSIRADGSDTTIQADPGQIEQVIMNLVVNARDAMPAGGRIEVEVGQYYMSAGAAREHGVAAPGLYALLEVSDSGEGMSREVQAQIFEPFFTTKEMGKGTGLGLAMVYGIVKQHQGHIYVSSEPGRGTTFEIYLPLVKDARESVEMRRGSEMPHGTETILIVDDEFSIRTLIQDILEPLGYACLVAESGASAMKVLEESEPELDLLLTDVIMPGTGGQELAKRVKERCPKAKILFMSGYTDRAMTRQGLVEVGAELIQKPITPFDLAHKVRQLLDRSTTKNPI